MRKNRFRVLRLLLVLVPPLLSSCSDPLSLWSKAPNPVQQITVHVGINWIKPAMNGGLFDQLRAEASGVYTQWTYETGENEDAGRRLKLTSGVLPDIWAFYGPNGQAQTDFLDAKVVEPIEKYLNMPDKYPNLAKIPKVIQEYCRAPDGHTYFIPLFISLTDTSTGSVRFDDGFWSWGQQGIFVRKDVLDKVGMSVSDLETLDGFERFLTQAATVQGPDGPLIPMTMGENFKGWRSAGYIFGVDSVGEAGGFSPFDGGMAAARDVPGYKRTWQWLNEMYQRGLLDRDVLTQKDGIYKQKLLTGKVAAYLGNMTDIAESGWAKAKDSNDVTTQFVAIPFPKVPDVAKHGAIESTTSMPWTGAYIMKGSDIAASLQYLDWTIGHDIMTVDYGPPGDGPKYVWNWTDADKTTWTFNPEYVDDLMSGDSVKIQKYGLQPYFLANTNIPDMDLNTATRNSLKYKLQKQSGTVLALTGEKRSMHNYDVVPVHGGCGLNEIAYSG